MTKVKFLVGCMAVYTSELEIPDTIAANENAVIDYIRDHLSDCTVDNLEWMEDLEPESAVTEDDILLIETDGQFRVTNIEWDTDKEKSENTLPTTIIIPEEYAEGISVEDIGEWLSNKYGFLHKEFSIIHVTGDELINEEKKLKKAVFEAGVNAIEKFLGHPLDDDEIDIESEMNDVLTQIPDEEYIAYLQKYKIIQ